MTKVTIEVTQAHIDAGTPRDPCICMLALAIAPRIDPRMCDFSVNRQAVLFFRPGWLASVGRVELPYEARKAVRDFDDDNTVWPFSFELDIPDAWLRP